MEEGVRKKGDRWIEGRTRGETVGTFWPLSRNFACSERSKGVCIYIYIPGDPESKLAGEKRFNERRKPSPPLFGNKDDEGRRIEKVRIKGTFFLRRKRRIFFLFFLYVFEIRVKINGGGDSYVYEFSNMLGMCGTYARFGE